MVQVYKDDKKIQIAERQKNRFLKQWVGNADSCMSILNKIMTTHEQYVKCNFVAP